MAAKTFQNDTFLDLVELIEPKLRDNDIKPKKLKLRT